MSEIIFTRSYTRPWAIICLTVDGGGRKSITIHRFALAKNRTYLKEPLFSDVKVEVLSTELKYARAELVGSTSPFRHDYLCGVNYLEAVWKRYRKWRMGFDNNPIRENDEP